MFGFAPGTPADALLPAMSVLSSVTLAEAPDRAMPPPIPLPAFPAVADRVPLPPLPPLTALELKVQFVAVTGPVVKIAPPVPLLPFPLKDWLAPLPPPPPAAPLLANVQLISVKVALFEMPPPLPAPPPAPAGNPLMPAAEPPRPPRVPFAFNVQLRRVRFPLLRMPPPSAAPPAVAGKDIPLESDASVPAVPTAAPLVTVRFVIVTFPVSTLKTRRALFPLIASFAFAGPLIVKSRAICSSALVTVMVKTPPTGS